MKGSADADNIGTSQSGTASTALTLHETSVTASDTDGLVDNETRGSAGTYNRWCSKCGYSIKLTYYYL